jgi:hypothetical protein
MKGARTLVKTIFLYVKGSSGSGSWVLKSKIVPFYKMLFFHLRIREVAAGTVLRYSIRQSKAFQQQHLAAAAFADRLDKQKIRCGAFEVSNLDVSAPTAENSPYNPKGVSP